MEDQSNKEITEKLRIENYEQYKQLVRMHLSFELDLNTDEFDLPCHEVVYFEKGKMKRWNRFSKKIKSCTSSKPNTNSPLDSGYINLTKDLIKQLRHLKFFLVNEENIIQEGIFRRTGAVSRQQKLRNLIIEDKPLELSKNYTIHDCATVYKGFLADLSEPLLTDAHYPAQCQIAVLCNEIDRKDLAVDKKKEQHILNSIQLLVLLLPENNRTLLDDIIDMLYTTSKYEEFNKMSPDTLATLFSPHLICPRNLPPEALHYVSQRMSSVISYMIYKGRTVFDIPAKLATDIRAYFHEVKRKKTMSPEQILDESISDISTVNTVYTFVDREKTAEAHNSNPTDTALAQLYAHIQSLPESSKKRKLIKQFNKENGQGTPLQLLMINRIKHSESNRSGKSISDSIKKHIFHKGIMSRTPKRCNTSTSTQSSTPNGAPKNPKLRVLFQSPVKVISSNRNHQNYGNFVNSDNATATINTMSSSSSSNLCKKPHSLQKSISASSILSSTISSDLASDVVSNITTKVNATLVVNKITSLSAPVSRVSSSDFGGLVNEISKKKSSNKILSDVVTQLITTTSCSSNNKFLNYKKQDKSNSETESSNKENLSENESDNIFKCIVLHNSSDLKSKFKSEPNLSRLLGMDKNYFDTPTGSSINDKTDGKFNIRKSLKNRLIKGVSMGNLRFPFSSLSSNSSDKMKNSSLFLEQKHVFSNESCTSNEDSLDSFKECLSTIQSEVEEPDYDNINNENSRLGFESINIEDSSQNLNVYRNVDLITSTPSQFLRRRSMSPITKSTQRMPKSMQESIMTPRSRKPVMLMATTLGSCDQNQTIYQGDLSNFNELEEESFLNNKMPLENITPNSHTIYKSRNVSSNFFVGCSEMEPKSIAEAANINRDDIQKTKYHSAQSGSLTNPFREYLLSRSVLTASPVDSSFSSQPDDFGSTPDIQDLNESQMSSSLLYCLDGNEPPNDVNLSEEDNNHQVSMYLSNCDSDDINVQTTKQILLKNRRKRCCSNNDDIENNLNFSNDILKSKKLLIIEESPSETSL